MHQYVKHGKFKNINCGYALVNGIVFGSIYDAEEYCSAHGYDVNTSIEADNPETLKRCQQIAKAALPGLRFLKEQCSELFYLFSDEVKAKADARDKAKVRRELGWEVHQEWVLQAIGKTSGCHDCMTKIMDYIFMLERILRIGKH